LRRIAAILFLLIIDSSYFLAVPGQYFCIYNGEDMSQVKVPITEVSREDTADLLDLLLGGESVEVIIASEGEL
jgi:hypothetical protein